MIYPIFRNNKLVVNVKPLSTSELYQKKQEDDVIKLNFTLEEFVDLQIGDYIVFEKTAQKYYLNKRPKVKVSPNDNSYECLFEGNIYELKKTLVFLDTPKEDGTFYRDYSFPLTVNAKTLLDFMVENLNREGSGYVAGIYADTEDTIIEFNKYSVYEAITSASDTLGFSWYLNGKVLNFDIKQETTSYLFQVGRKVGFVDLTRARTDNVDIETVVYGYGSTDNLPPRTADSGITYDSSTITENRLSFVGENGLSKLSKNTDLYGVRESVQIFDIYPTFTGVVDGIDSTNRFIFTDGSINFDIETQKISGITPKINFLTGKLIGLTFDISFDYETGTITMDTYSDESGDYPNSLLYPEIGDTYKLFDIVMPDVYLEDAKTRLKQATQDYLDNQSQSLDYYTGSIDKEYIQSKGIVLNLGDIIRVVNSEFNIDNNYEIKSLTQKIVDPNDYAIGFGDTLPKSFLSSLKINNFTTTQSIYSVKKSSVTNNQVTNIIGGASVEWL